MDTLPGPTPISVLIAEDDENIALALYTVIKKAFSTNRVDLVSNGANAWSLVQNNIYDIIISDWNMPLVTGLSLLESTRKSDTNANTPFLMLTARADKPSVVSAAKAGASDYLAKPYGKQELVEKINKLLNMKIEEAADPESGF